MATVLDICTRALRRGRVIDALATPSAADAVVARDALNEMLQTWQAQSCNMLLQADFALADTFALFIPPLDADSDTIQALSYRGTWDASANSPALASGTGTEGYAYKVTTAGSTTLDDVTSWALNDYAVFDGVSWLKSVNSQRLEGAVVALLTKRLSDDFGYEITQQLATDAAQGWYRVLSYYVKPPTATIDQGLRQMPSRTLAVSFDDLE